MHLGLNGKRALVCGASKGLGRACADALARAGVQIVLVARGVEALHAAAADIARQTGVRVVPVAADITTPDGRSSALAAAAQLEDGRSAQFDIIVTNAGGPPAGDFSGLGGGRLAPGSTPTCWPRSSSKATIDDDRTTGAVVNVTSTTVKASAISRPVNGARASDGFVAGHASGPTASPSTTCCPALSRPIGWRPTSWPPRGRRRRQTRTWNRDAREFRRAASARPRSSARRAHSCAARRPATSPPRIC